ncbi:MAG: YgfZ/GcvT domain-containing protein, partial [Phycisphaerales bacterium]
EALAAGLAAVDDAAEAVLLVDEPAHQGFEVFVRTAAVREFWTAVTAIENARPAGWFAQNLIRLEAGQPRFGIDFNQEFLPHETDLVHQRVSFTKGCYPGQEVVARMQHLADGSTKRRVVGLHFPEGEVPPAGAPILRDENGAPGEVLGQVTSSGPSPMASSRGIGLGVLVKAAQDASLLVVNEEGPGRVEVVERSELVPPVLRESKDESEEPNREEPS